MPSAKNQRRKCRAGQSSPDHRLKVLLATLFLLVFLIASLLLLAEVRRIFSPSPEPSVADRFTMPIADVDADTGRAAAVATGPRLAIIMDDLGRDVATARELLAIDLPVTFSIMPGTANAGRVAVLAHDSGREVMLHIPMEPLHYPTISPGQNALFTDLSQAEIRRRFRGYLKRVPHAVGGNNHMGSRFTQSREGMSTVLEEMKRADLFFVDSLTTEDSVAFDEARKAGLQRAVRDVFLDNVREVERISAQIRKLADLAGRRGFAVGICHPYPQTLAALRRAAPFLRRQGIEVVPVSQLLVR